MAEINDIIKKIRLSQKYGDMPRYVRGKYNAICVKHPFMIDVESTEFKQHLHHCEQNDLDPDYGPADEEFDAFFNNRQLAEEWCAWHTLNGYEYKLYSIETITTMYAEYVAEMEALEMKCKGTVNE